MADNPPYLASPGSAPKALEKIKTAATPDRFTTDFVNTVLGFKGGTGAALIPFFKRMGLVASDGTPTELYNRFRNPASSKQAMAQAMKVGYKLLYERNEYIHKANDDDLKGVVVEVTGASADMTMRSEDPMDFTTFGELAEIIKANWSVFGAIFSSVRAVEKVMNSLNALRAPIAHCTVLSEDEALRLRLSVRDWYRLME